MAGCQAPRWFFLATQIRAPVRPDPTPWRRVKPRHRVLSDADVSPRRQKCDVPEEALEQRKWVRGNLVQLPAWATTSRLLRHVARAKAKGERAPMLQSAV
jgi:hypothetical protein